MRGSILTQKGIVVTRDDAMALVSDGTARYTQKPNQKYLKSSDIELLWEKGAVAKNYPRAAL